RSTATRTGRSAMSGESVQRWGRNKRYERCKKTMFPMPKIRSRDATVWAVVVMALFAASAMVAPRSGAEPPPSDVLIRPLPVIVPKQTGWQPKFPFPYDQTRNHVTAADIQAEGEMCQWFTAQYQILNDQIGRLQFDRITPNGDGDYGVPGVQQQVDIV